MNSFFLSSHFSYGLSPLSRFKSTQSEQPGNLGCNFTPTHPPKYVEKKRKRENGKIDHIFLLLAYPSIFGDIMWCISCIGTATHMGVFLKQGKTVVLVNRLKARGKIDAPPSRHSFPFFLIPHLSFSLVHFLSVWLNSNVGS
ncbi:unnamed protein product [Prunus brigantina]